jgi:dTDP-L-rhamnose 4-epimerase
MGSQLALITGGAGFIGSHLAQILLERGYRVRVLDSLVPQVHGPERRFPPHLDPRVECILGDIRDREIVSSALREVDLVFHLAALTGVGQSMYQVDAYTQTNVGGTATLLRCLVDRPPRLRRLVLASSRAVYGEGKYMCVSCGTVYPQSRSVHQLDAKQWELACPRCEEQISSAPTDESSLLQPSSVYAITKKAQEELVLCVGQAYELPVTILRYFNVYGPGQAPSNPYTGLIVTFLSRLMSGQLPELYEDGQMQRDFVHVRDVVDATVTAAECPEAIGQVINVGSGKGVTVAQVAEVLIEIVGASESARQVGVARVGDVRHVVADIRRAMEILGYAPQVSLREGLTELVEWFRHQDRQVDRSIQARFELEQHNLLR